MTNTDYEYVSIGKIGKVITGKTPSTSNKEYYNGSYMFISPTELHGDYVITKSEKTITEDGMKSIKSNVIQGTSVLVGCIGWDMGNVAMCFDKCATNQQINSITNIKSKYNPYYVYYWLKGKKDYLFSIASVTRTPILSKSVFEEVVIPFPKKDKQDSIVRTLLKIDEKILINNKINDNLEHQLEDIYNYWFTQYDFAQTNGQPYKSTGGFMVWNEQIKRNIPANWEVKLLGEICSFRNGVNYDKNIEGDKTYRIVNVRNISSSTIVLGENDLDKIRLPQKQGDKYCVSNESIIVARSGIPGAPRVLHKPNDNTIFCGFIICCTPCNKILQYYLTFYLKQLEGSSATQTGGSILQNVSQDTLSSLLVPIPPEGLLNKFNEIVLRAFDIIHNNMNENARLHDMRDWLLPMLMNGQVSVEN